MQQNTDLLAARCRNDLLRRNSVLAACFEVEAPRLVRACREMARRFLNGGRLLAFGRGAAATDAQHVSVEFVHPVIVGKRALPALDLGSTFESTLPVLLSPEDMVMGFAFPEDPVVDRCLELARSRGALTLGFYSQAAEFPFGLPDRDPFTAQEVAEVLYHILWESLHLFFEHREQGHDVGLAGFLYPFLGQQQQALGDAEEAVHASMLEKVTEVNGLRAAFAEREAPQVARMARAIQERVRRGGWVLTLGNGGSASDANDLALDCAAPPPEFAPIPALSLAAEPASITGVANDIGAQAIFSRQLIAHARAADVLVAISTSGGSSNVLSALGEARRLGLMTVALLGYDGGRIVRDGLADHSLVVHAEAIPRIQEVQASVYHVLRCLLQQLQTEHRSDA